MAHTLLIPLVGLMQSWGTRSRFEDRDTHPEPTKSAVIGLLCSALGRGRTEDISDLQRLRMGVRTDTPGRPQTDYQTAQNVRTADGNMKDTVLSTRHYLADARFLVGLENDDMTLLITLEEALKNPVWTLSLGRKSYPLTVPPYFPQGSIRQNMGLQEALKAEPWHYLMEKEKTQRQDSKASLRLLLEATDGEGEAFADTPLHFGERRFGTRRVVISTMPADGISMVNYVPES
jgi:CRISPR system Cascade subunit CasD